MKKNSTVATKRKKIFREKKLTIGMDLGDRFTYYCVLDEAGEVVVEQKLATTKQAMKQAFSRMPSSRVALETGAHSPWVSRQLTQLGHEVIVAHARNVRLIGESSRKDDRLDARMLARLARLDPRALVGIFARCRQSFGTFRLAPAVEYHVGAWGVLTLLFVVGEVARNFQRRPVLLEAVRLNQS
jgi:hypothetical protein